MEFGFLFYVTIDILPRTFVLVNHFRTYVLSVFSKHLLQATVSPVKKFFGMRLYYITHNYLSITFIIIIIRIIIILIIIIVLCQFNFHAIIMISGGIIMPNIELTETLRTTIRTLRKEKRNVEMNFPKN